MALHSEFAQSHSLAGKVAVVTAAGSGIGQEIARILALAGATVVATDIAAEGLETTRQSIQASGGQAEARLLDVSSKQAVDATAESVAADHGRIDIWVNCAGISPLHTILETDPDVARRTIDINLLGTHWGCMAAAQVMKRQSSGSIINISSAGGGKPVPNLSIYGMTKAAVNSLTWTAAAEFGHFGVRVNAIAPGWIETPAADVLYRDAAGNFDPAIKEDVQRQMRSSSPLGRLGTPSDIAFAVAYLASDAASFVTGQIWRVNGGESM